MTRLLRAAEALTFAAALISTLHPRWLEAAFGIDPDGGSGSIEILVAVGLGLVLLLLVTLDLRLRRTRT